MHVWINIRVGGQMGRFIVALIKLNLVLLGYGFNLFISTSSGTTVARCSFICSFITLFHGNFRY